LISFHFSSVQFISVHFSSFQFISFQFQFYMFCGVQGLGFFASEFEDTLKK